MNYLTVKEIAEKWGLGTRIVTLYCVEKRIDGVVKRGNLWLIPEHAQRPVDKRRKLQPVPRLSLSDCFDSFLAATTNAMPLDNPDSVLDTVNEERMRLQYEGEIAYLRGDFSKSIDCYKKTFGDDAARLRACPMAIVAAISLGDYQLYTEIETYLKKIAKTQSGSSAAAYAELALATAAVSIYAPNMVPDWLKEGNLSALAPQARINALYLRVKYFHCLRKYDAMLAVAQTALAVYAQPRGFTLIDLYLRVTCAIACFCLGHDDEARRWLLEAMRLALPHGFITPFAETVTSLGGLTEQCLEREFPAYRKAVLGQWDRTWKNWITFHNQFTKDNITLMLTLREYHLALLVANRVPYAQIAKKHCISVGRLKNIMLEIYEKLCISGREELSKYI
ncbi:MAG: helix-turn-helix transcriptional regulator [Bacillota bacterium]